MADSGEKPKRKKTRRVRTVRKSKDFDAMEKVVDMPNMLESDENVLDGEKNKGMDDIPTDGNDMPVCPHCGCSGDSQQNRKWEFDSQFMRYRCRQCGILYQLNMITNEIEV